MLYKIKLLLHNSYIRKFLISLILINISIFIIFEIVTYSQANLFMSSNTKYNVENQCNNVITAINDYIFSKLYSLKQISTNNDIEEYLISSTNNKNYSKVSDFLNKIIDIDKDISSAWFVSEKQNFYIASGGNISDNSYDMKLEPWYSQLAVNPDSANIWFSDIAQSVSLKDDAVIIVTAIRSNGNLIGYAGIDISADNLNSAISNLNIPENYYPLIVSKNGDIIYSDSSKEFNKSFSITDNNVIKSINHAVQSNKGTDEINNNNITSYITYEKSNLTDWRILICYDGIDVHKKQQVFFLQHILIFICFILIIVFAVFMKTGYTFKNLLQLMDSVNKINSKIFNNKMNLNSNDCIKQMTDCINNLSSDIEEKTEMINSLTNFDELTKLPNRNSLYTKINELVTFSEKNLNKFAVIFISINNLKWVNDTLGHNFGDEFLKCFANKLKEFTDKYGEITRFCSDEFILLLSFNNISEINLIIDKIKLKFEKPISVFSSELHVKFSVGVSLYPDDDLTGDLLLRDADIAVNIAKRNILSNIEFYNNSLHKSISGKTIISQKLADALNNGELYLNYQPIISTGSQEIQGLEVLVRWTNSELGTVPPSEFIPVAEETGLIVPIGTWIFETACRFYKTLCSKFDKDIFISINVSPYQLLQSDYVENIKRVLKIIQINPRQIQLEITETVLITLFKSTSDVLNELSALGITIALDDFGTGYNSLNYLKHFPIDCLKIDKSFIDGIHTNKKDYAIADSIIELVHNLNITTVAEGVETKGQIDTLNDMKCDLVQGYLMSKPLSESQIFDFIENYK